MKPFGVAKWLVRVATSVTVMIGIASCDDAPTASMVTGSAANQSVYHVITLGPYYVRAAWPQYTDMCWTMDGPSSPPSTGLLCGQYYTFSPPFLVNSIAVEAAGDPWDESTVYLDVVTPEEQVNASCVRDGGSSNFLCTAEVRDSSLQISDVTWEYANASGTAATHSDAGPTYKSTFAFSASDNGWVHAGWRWGDAAREMADIQIVAPAPAILITCNQSTTAVAVQRGLPVSCTATPVGGGTLTDVAFSFTGDESGISLSAAELAPGVVSNGLSGPAVASGVLTATGQNDNRPATGTIRLNILPRTTGFAWGQPSGNGQVPENCESITTLYGWAALHQSCDQWYTIYPAYGPNYVTTAKVSGGPNAGLYYTTGFTAAVNVGYNLQPEIKGAGLYYTVLGSDSRFSACFGGITRSVRVVLLNSCMNVSMSAVEAHTRYHESCHVALVVQSFNSLMGNSASVTSLVPSQVEALVGKSDNSLRYLAADLVEDANGEIRLPSVALHNTTGPSISFWWPTTRTSSGIWTFNTKAGVSC